MRRFLQWGVLVAIFILISGGCAAEKAPTAALKAADVSMTTCVPSFIGAESICMTPVLRISNPNDFTIAVDLEYELKVDGELVGASQIPTVYVPSGGTVDVKDGVVIPFTAWFAGVAMRGGKSAAEAIAFVAPLWKGLGGKRPGLVPEALWDKLGTSKPTIAVIGSINVSTETSQKLLPLSLQWKEAE